MSTADFIIWSFFMGIPNFGGILVGREFYSLFKKSFSVKQNVKLIPSKLLNLYALCN